MNKELEALQELRDLVEYLTRIDYVSTAVRNEVKELLIKSYRDSNGYFSQIEEALKRNEPMKPKVAWKNQEDEGVVAYRCLNCNGSLGAKLDDKPMFPNFCRHCGQKLDWSDEK